MTLAPLQPVDTHHSVNIVAVAELRCGMLLVAVVSSQLN